MNPKISIIVPVYKVEQYLPCCIDSILAQTFTDFELLLIDDGSPDKSGDICDKYAAKDCRIRVFHKENGGVSSARNMGLNNAKGEWITFVDSDDWLEENYVEVLVGDEEPADLTFWGCSLHYPDGSCTRFVPSPAFCTSSKGEIEEQLVFLKENMQHFEYLGYTWNKLFKASIIENNNIRFVEGLNIREDEIFTLDYACYIQSLRVIPIAFYHYRILSSGLTYSCKSSQEYQLFARAMLRVIQNFNDSRLLHLELNSILGHLLMSVMTHTTMMKYSWWLDWKKLWYFYKKYQSFLIPLTSKRLLLVFKFNNWLYAIACVCILFVWGNPFRK